MLRKPSPQQTALEMVSLDGLVPKDHLLRKIDAVIDFSFIHDRVAGLYCPDNGRPPLDPTVMFKALFIGYLFGVRSERQLVREIEVNVAYRWFLGLKLTDPVFDASTLSQNRRRRYHDTSVAQTIFDTIVEQAIAKGLVDGTVLYTDSTHLKANANKNRYDTAVVAKSRADYWDALDAAIEQDRTEHGKKALPEKEHRPAEKETKVSRTDPDAGYMVREGKPKGFFYLDHRTVDGRLGIITDTYATPANVHDSIVYLGRLDRQRQRFDFDVGAVGLDAGYATSGIAQGLEQRGILGVTGYRRPVPPRSGMMASKLFAYEAERDGYRCPQGQLLAYATTDRTGYRHYKSDPAICRSCPLLASHPVGQAYLQAPQGDRRTFFRRRQATPRPPLRPLSRPPRRHLPVPARRRRTEHQEDRSRPGSQARIGLSTVARLRPTILKTKPRRKSTGFVSGLSAALGRPFDWLLNSSPY